MCYLKKNVELVVTLNRNFRKLPSLNNIFEIFFSINVTNFRKFAVEISL